MYAIKLAALMWRPCSVKIIPRLLDNRKRNCFRSYITPAVNLKSQMQQDAVLYKLENPRFFVTVNLLSGINCAFWTYLGVFLFNSVTKAEQDTKKGTFWRKLVDGNTSYILVLGALSGFFAWSVLGGTLFYTVRSVRKLILHKGGKNLTVITYKLPGLNNTFKISLREISSNQARNQAKKFIPLKIKNKSFYYLLDIKGEFLNPELFDFTAGVQRNV